MVGADDLDFLAVDVVAKIGDRHARGLDRSLAAEIGIKTRHVVQDADLDGVAGDLRLRRRRYHQRRRNNR